MSITQVIYSNHKKAAWPTPRRATKRLSGTHVALMAAALADGATLIENAAREPEVVDLANCLIKMGARIEGAGTSRIVVTGVSRLHGATHEVLPDRIETGTYAMAAAMTGGDVTLENTRPELLQFALDILEQAGAEVTSTNQGLRVRRNGGGIRPVDVTTDPFPGFPTDLQAQFMALMTKAKGTSRIRETIFENRFMHVQELARLGARIRLDGDSAYVEGVERLRGAPVMATDLRASVSLVDRRPGGRGRDHHQPGLPPRPGLRGPGDQARPLRGGHRASEGVGARSRDGARPQKPMAPRLRPKPGMKQEHGEFRGTTLPASQLPRAVTHTEPSWARREGPRRGGP